MSQFLRNPDPQSHNVHQAMAYRLQLSSHGGSSVDAKIDMSLEGLNVVKDNLSEKALRRDAKRMPSNAVIKKARLTQDRSGKQRDMRALPDASGTSVGRSLLIPPEAVGETFFVLAVLTINGRTSRAHTRSNDTLELRAQASQWNKRGWEERICHWRLSDNCQINHVSAAKITGR